MNSTVMKKTLCVLSLALGLGWSDAAFAQLINVNFTSPSAASYFGAAVVGAAGDHWNAITDFSGTPIAGLKDSDGNTTGVTVSAPAFGWSYQPGNSGFTGTPYQELMAGYIFEFNSAASARTIAFTGLSSNSAYDLYIYSQGDKSAMDRTLNVDVNGAFFSTTASNGNVSSFIPNQNYLHIHALTDGGGNLSIKYWKVSPPEADINGIQLVSSVPEPATVVLIGAGGIVAIAMKRKERE